MQRLVFLHANGFPAAVYGQFLAALRASVDVQTIGVLETPAATAPAERWRRMREQVAEQVRRMGPVTLCGHSMGGYLSLFAASDCLPRQSPVILIDSPIPAPLPAAVLRIAQQTGLAYRYGPAPIAARRRDRWANLEEARGYFAGKPFVQRWAPGVLDDFLTHGLHHQGDATRLRIPREEERDIYANLPTRPAARALACIRSVGIPVGFVAGADSAEMRLAGLPHNRRLFGERWVQLQTGHLVPMEAPQDCASAVLSLMAGMSTRQ